MNKPHTILLGGGCFWCTEAIFKLIPGVLKVMPGYAGGLTTNPTYEAVCTGTTGHAEVVQVAYDPAKISLDSLLDWFLTSHDPTSLNQQGNDIGTQYRSYIGVETLPEKAKVFEYLAKKQADFAKKIVTEIAFGQTFYEAEKYHHDYFANNPDSGYCQLVIKPKVEKVKHTLSTS